MSFLDNQEFSGAWGEGVSPCQGDWVGECRVLRETCIHPNIVFGWMHVYSSGSPHPGPPPCGQIRFFGTRAALSPIPQPLPRLRMSFSLAILSRGRGENKKGVLAALCAAKTPFLFFPHSGERREKKKGLWVAMATHKPFFFSPSRPSRQRIPEGERPGGGRGWVE